MDNTVKKHVVTIGDEVYTLLADEPEAVVLAAVRQLNELMAAISLQSSVADKKKIAVLSALQMAILLTQCKQQLAAMELDQQALVRSIETACAQAIGE